MSAQQIKGTNKFNAYISMNNTANLEKLLAYLLGKAIVPNVSFCSWIRHDGSISFDDLDSEPYDIKLEEKFEEESQLLNAKRSLTDQLFIDHKIKVLQEEIKAESLKKIKNPFLKEFIRILKIIQEEDRRMALMYFSMYITEKNLSFTDFWRVMAISYNHFPDLFSAFPALAAQHLMDGYVLELMFGVSDRVLENWVRQIFYQIKSYLNNALFKVISVFGPQSTGKSTLLNNLFGTSFNVSRNTCTRGINARIIPRMDGEKREFLLLIDAEGIESTEDKENSTFCDNRIACLSIIPADISLILTRGESSNQVADFLPILHLESGRQDLFKKIWFIVINQNMADNENDQSVSVGALKEKIKSDFSLIRRNIDLENFKYEFFGNDKTDSGALAASYYTSCMNLKRKILSAGKSRNLDSFSNSFLRLNEKMLKNFVEYSQKNVGEIIKYRSSLLKLNEMERTIKEDYDQKRINVFKV